MITSAPKVVVFGAGATGRGHVGLLCWQKGCKIVFVDKNVSLVKLLQQSGQYRVHLFSGSSHPNQHLEVNVSGFRIYDSESREAITQEILSADLVLTAVFDQNLTDVAQTLAMAVRLCRQSDREDPLHVIACENMMDSSSTLGKLVEANLDPEDLEYFQKIFAFPDCMISRVVPRPASDPLLIITEDYNEWTVRKESLKGPLPAEIDFIEAVSNQNARLERKLFIHNGGHAVCGYIGFHRGCYYIHEAVQDPVVTRFVSGALDELGEIVQHKHGFNKEEIEAYKADLVRRGGIEALNDEILRVVRDPMRKLSARERLVAPAMIAEELGLPRKWINLGIVAVLKYMHPRDPQSIELQNLVKREGLPATLQKISGLGENSILSQEIEAAWNSWHEYIKI